ncbi:MAG: hypothetical protein H0U07_09170, partial [Actinobacteria bacterium]|nr:hypothetical protein [Actinomycetota bacterium]
LESVSAVFARVERDVIRRATGDLAGGLVHVLARFTGWIETAFVGRGERVVDRLGQAFVHVSASVERRVFQEGIHLGVPRAGDVLGRVLTRTEERLGHPAVIGSILFVALLALLVGTAWG